MSVDAFELPDVDENQLMEVFQTVSQLILNATKESPDFGGETLFVNDPLIQGIVPKKHRLIVFSNGVWYKSNPFRDFDKYVVVFKYK